MGRQRIGHGVVRLEAMASAAAESREQQRVERAAKAAEARAKIAVARPAKPLKPAQCRAWVRRTVAAHMPEILEGFLNEAIKGGCAHLKMATETVASAEGKPKARRGKSEAELMMEELEKEFGN